MPAASSMLTELHFTLYTTEAIMHFYRFRALPCHVGARGTLNTELIFTTKTACAPSVVAHVPKPGVSEYNAVDIIKSLHKRIRVGGTPNNAWIGNQILR